MNQESLWHFDGDSGTQIRKLTPKRPQSDKAGLADIFPYYAGFSFEWAKGQLRLEGFDENAVVLDPWNGSGTTTLAARVNDLKSVGVDLNPIANIVAYLRLQDADHMEPCAAPTARSARASQHEPLLAWFSSRTAGRFRQWSRSLSKQPHSTSSLGYVALFRVTRSLTKGFEGSNPTWVRRASNSEDVVDVASRDLDDLIVQEQRHVKDRVSEESHPGCPASIIRASSACLPMAEESVDFILSSPPYLTRIDYAVAYSRELAILGVDISKDRSLRSSLMGTTLIRRRRDVIRQEGYGPKASQLVENISKHDSKASSGYYLKQAKQYLDDLTLSFDELTRVSKRHALMTLVVQDSYYKEVPIRLAEICVEEAERRGWSFIDWDQAEVTRLLTQVNTAARAYPKGKVAETVVTLRRKRS
nr:hypothetical protein GCM10010200_054170 [Actinomadura rugatobispora]